MSADFVGCPSSQQACEGQPGCWPVSSCLFVGREKKEIEAEGEKANSNLTPHFGGKGGMRIKEGAHPLPF